MVKQAGLPVVCIAGTSSGVGKTSIAVGLMAALREKGLTVQAFKVGPDFIDPLHHEQATGRPSINLDGWLLSQEQVVQSFHRHTADADVAVVEGVMGLFDGRDGHSDQGSTAQVAKWLGAPVLLVLDCSAIARSAAAVVKGYLEFDPALHLGGLLFNKVGGEAHTKWLADAIESAGLSVPVLGGIPKDEGVEMKERYLGLHLPGEEGVPRALIPALAQLCKANVDLDALLRLARSAEVPPPPPPPPAAAPPATAAAAAALAAAGGGGGAGGDGAASPPPLPPPVRIAVARDAAFCFYYQENLSLLREAGAELVFFSPIKDAALPSGISGVYLGGGYPERFALELADNRSMRMALRAFARAGGVVYAECGGLLYLSSSMQLQDEGTSLPMVGLFPFKTVMGRMTMGYVEVETKEACPLFPPGGRARGQWHHHTKIVEEHVVGGASQGSKEGVEEKGYATGYIARPQVPGAPEVAEGFSTRNVLASYVHLHFGSCPQFAAALVERCQGVGPAAIDAALAEAVAAATGEGLYGESSSLRTSPQKPGSLGMLPVRSSPNLGREDRLLARRGRSMDHHQSQHHPHAGHLEDSASFFGAAGVHERGLPGGRPPTSLDFSHAGLPHRHHSLHLPQGRFSPATTLAKVLSSGSLSNQTFHSSADPHALHAVDPETVSPLSSGSPPLSPRDHHHHHHPASAAALAAAAGMEPYHHHPSSGGGAPFGGPPHPHHSPLQAHDAPPHGAYHPVPGAGFAPAPAGPLAHSFSWSQPPGYGAVLVAHGRRNSYGGSHGSPPQSVYSQHAPAGAPRHHGLPSHLAPQHAHHTQQAQHAQQQQQAYYAPSRPRSLGSKPSSFSSLDHHLAVSSTVGPSPLQPAAAHSHGSTPAAGAALAPCAWQQPSHPPSDKIVALSPGAAEILWALGLGSRVVGVSEGCDYPPEALLRAKALRRETAPGSTTASAGPGGFSGSFLARSSSAESLSAPSGEHPQRHGSSGRGGGGGSRGSWFVDEQVLARERPGLIVYEEEAAEEDPLQQRHPQQHAQQRPDVAAAAAAPPAAALASGWYGGSSLECACGGSEEEGGAGQGACSTHGGGGPGRVGQAVLDALVAVGLQQSCRVVCIQRRSLSEVLDSMLSVGEAAGVAPEAVRAVDRLRTRLRWAAGQAAVAAAQSGRRPPRVLLLQSALPLRTAGWWAADLVVLAGGENAEEQAGDPPKALTWEQVQAYAPEVLVVASLQHPLPPTAPGPSSSEAGGSGASCRALSDLSELAARPGWWQLPAVKEGRVFVADHALFCRPGPRLVEGVEALARMVHEEEVQLLCPERAVLKLSLRPGQRCRHRVLPNYFMAFE